MANDSVVYFERIEIGASAKLVAVDANTGIEVSVIGPVHASQADMQRLAMAKLKARIARERT